MQSTLVTVGKLGAMQRQLDTAIHLWFADGDPVSIHTLASAAHELLHALFKKSGRSGLLFDFPNVKEEYRSFMAKELKKNFNFFKHGRTDIDKIIKFDPLVNEFVIFYSVRGLNDMGIELSFHQKAFRQWHFINRPEFLVEGAYDGQDIEIFAHIRTLSKQEFMHNFHEAWVTSQ